MKTAFLREVTLIFFPLIFNIFRNSTSKFSVTAFSCEESLKNFLYKLTLRSEISNGKSEKSQLKNTLNSMIVYVSLRETLLAHGKLRVQLVPWFGKNAILITSLTQKSVA